MTTILLIRHGIAEDPLPGRPDAERSLTVEGWEKTRAAMTGLVRLGHAPTQAVSSPYVRAAQTLVCLKEAAPLWFPVSYWEGLVPEGSVFEAEVWLRGELAALGSEEVLALVSHQPFCSELTRHLTGQWIAFKRAACAVLRFEEGRFRLESHFQPKELRKHGKKGLIDL
ncbi:MAG: histidine phosphatase family protein [Firmicutes bacterium]|nr:histidine phosphatase family protein [Bacillota bacterium]